MVILRRGWALVLAAACVHVGCKRTDIGGGATQVKTTPVQSYDEQPVKVETDPAKLLFSAIVYRDQAKVAQLLREHKELVNQKLEGAYPLARVCETRSLEMVKAVVEQGADVNARFGEGHTALWHAVSADSLPIVKYLVEKGADVKVLDDDGASLLWPVESKEVAAFLVSKGVDPKHKDRFNDTALHRACRHSAKEYAEFLLDAGVGIEEKGRYNMPPLHSAGTTSIGDPRPVVKMLLARGADINSHGFKGHTLIHECVFYDRLEMADLLISRGAEIDLKDDDGHTPIQLADTFGKNERTRIKNLLIKSGAPGQLIPLPKD